MGVLDQALPRTRLGRIWTYVGDDDHPYTVYDYTPNRSQDGPQAFMEKFSGFLQADAYSGYDELYLNPERDVIEVACWAHTRRKFYEAQSSELICSRTCATSSTASAPILAADWPNCFPTSGRLDGGQRLPPDSSPPTHLYHPQPTHQRVHRTLTECQ